MQPQLLSAAFSLLMSLSAQGAAAGDNPRQVVESYYQTLEQRGYRSTCQFRDNNGEEARKSFNRFREEFSATVYTRGGRTGEPR